MDGWVGGWMGAKAGLRIAYSNQKERLGRLAQRKTIRLVINFSHRERIRISRQIFSSVIKYKFALYA